MFKSRPAKIFAILGILFSSMIASGCNGHGGSSSQSSTPATTGTISFDLTATTDDFSFAKIKAANITVSRVDVQSAGTNGAVTSTTVVNTAQTIDLMNVTNGLQHLLAQPSLKPGIYDHVVLYITGASLDLWSGSSVNLSVPAAASAGMVLPINPAIQLAVGSSAQVLIEMSISNTFQPVLNASNQVIGWNFVPNPIVIDPAHTATLAGNVLSDMGTPKVVADDRGVFGASVKVYKSGTLVASTVSLADGSFRLLGLLPGTYDISVSGPGYTTSTANNVFLTAGATQNLNFTLGLVAGAVWGNVSSGGYPVYGAQVTLSRAGVLVAVAYSDSNGFYYIDNLAAGNNYSVKTSANGYFDSASVGVNVISGLAARQDFLMVLNTGSIVGVVKDVSSGLAVSWASVTISQGGFWVASVYTGYDGRYSVAGLNPGNYDIAVNADGYNTANVYSDAVFAATTTVQNINLTPLTGEVSGRITDSITGSGISSAYVTISQGGWTVATVYTDYLGYYQMSLQPGFYDISVSAYGYSSNSGSFSVSSGWTTTENLSMAVVTGSIGGTVRDAITMATISGATVTVTQSGSSWVYASTTTDFYGSYAIYNLPPGSYTLTVSAFGYADVVLSESIISNTMTNQDVNL